MVEKTIYVPTFVTEKRKVTLTECRTETRERTVTVYRRVPETKTVQHTYTVMVPQARTRTVTYNVCKPVFETQTRQYTACVPHQEVRHCVRVVCNLVPTKQMRTVCRDRGHWEERVIECQSHAACRPRRRCGECGAVACAPATRTCRVWVPNIVQEKVEITVMCPQRVEVPYDRTVTVYRPEQRTCKVRVCHLVSEQKTCEMQYTVCVPEQRTRSCQVTTYKCVAEQKTLKYTVNVPHKVEKEIEVRVCKMVPKTVLVPRCDTVCQPCYASRRARRCRRMCL